MTNGTDHQALVVTTFSRRMNVRLAGGDEVPAKVKGKRLQPVCGDRVRIAPIENEPEWLITDILPRHNELTRPNMRGKTEVLAANLTFILVVVADPPKPDWFIADRYLCAAEIMGVRAAIVFNKTDLDSAGDDTAVALQEYRDIGYPVISSSAKTGAGLDELRALLSGETAIVVGQSGVGKSSLINRITDGAGLRTGAVSAASGEGRHTTVNSAMLALPGGGAVIDSPGVRDYAPAIESPDQVATGFPEIRKRGMDCKYANCRHLREPDCAVKAAVESGEIGARRYESYRRLLNLTEKLGQKRY